MDNIIKAAQESGHLQIISVSAPQPHLAAQPGLRGHSVSPEDDLLKRYVVERKTPSGWLGLSSHDDAVDATVSIASRPSGEYRIFDQIKRTAVES